MDVVAIDLRGKTSLADTIVVASGRSSTHVGADAGDAIIHIFRPEVREFYNLEKMWGGLRPGEQRAG